MESTEDLRIGQLQDWRIEIIVCASRHPPRPLGGLENWRLGGLRIGDPEMCIGGCFMVPGGGPITSKIAASQRARATGRDRGGEISVF